MFNQIIQRYQQCSVPSPGIVALYCCVSFHINSHSKSSTIIQIIQILQMIIPTMIIMILTIRIEPFPIPLLPREKHLPGSGHRTPSTDGDADDADGDDYDDDDDDNNLYIIGAVCLCVTKKWPIFFLFNFFSLIFFSPKNLLTIFFNFLV